MNAKKNVITKYMTSNTIDITIEKNKSSVETESLDSFNFTLKLCQFFQMQISRHQLRKPVVPKYKFIGLDLYLW